MKKRPSLPAALLLSALCALAHGAEPTSPTQAANTPSVIGEEHRRLADLVGFWNVKQSIWPAPDQPPQVDSGTALFAMVLGDRHLQQELRVASRIPFQAIGYMGYDTQSRTYYASWMDVNLTDALLFRGTFDAGRHAWRFSGTMAGENGQPIPVREDLELLDAHHFVVRYFETRDAREALVVELAYSRP